MGSMKHTVAQLPQGAKKRPCKELHTWGEFFTRPQGSHGWVKIMDAAKKNAHQVQKDAHQVKIFLHGIYLIR